MMRIISHSAEETKTIANKLAGVIQGGDLILLLGDLGAGKTCFTQGLAQGLALPDHEMVTSPSYALCNILHTTPNLAHFDLYRLGDAVGLEETGLYEYLEEDDVFVVVEWPNAFLDEFPDERLEIRFEQQGTHRELSFSGGASWESRLLGLQHDFKASSEVE